MHGTYPAIPPEIDEFIYILLAAAFLTLGGKEERDGKEALVCDVWFAHHLIRTLTFYPNCPKS